MAHFQREAEVLTSLNHPNIAHIQLYRHTHGVGRDSAAISHKVLAELIGISKRSVQTALSHLIE